MILTVKSQYQHDGENNSKHDRHRFAVAREADADVSQTQGDERIQHDFHNAHCRATHHCMRNWMKVIL